ncbi:uncharacterized protein LOC127724474 isoform X1 [Mytilus californianus]|uniref:uncharacterized protein LOC127724474 isoform X1 n=1 Tax=Mytilus californianus TaxID=6549 RepID=UPI002246682C|nr:uncharacterized protein LOC127724474 isoform X1 [Mytilus californianus]XP_052087402.1 uncharacterized protein LOC127724474 isoform X1 [Mytilus californianus]XP_052087403.1 uncharacterized protein LOC127724474 isoform X1 [Mytilus californianus]XP_052087404.1 uncharacterized protein LOC127724474 isoform X1 [Mytilus californianus]XP_052087405.1 uncharacterized protein LOC127724474 isoform X1 [Mytilus californianus]
MSMESLINLDTLTEEERKIILSVLKKDDELKKSQDRKIGHLKLEIQAIRMKSVLRNGDDLSKICARCHAELGFLFNRGDLCPKCHFRVCRACQEQGLAGTWLCTLCHKQRQLKFFMEEWNKKGKPNKKTGTDLVKASIVRQRRPGRVNDDTSQVEKSRGVQNGNPVQNGTAFRSKKEAENERIEYPNDSDKRKLSQLFDSFKLGKSSEKTEQVESKHQVSVKKLTTKRYDDSDESSSSDDDRSSRDSSPNVTHRMTDTRSADDFVTASNLTRGVLQRNYSDDSDQTAMSDETPFMKNTGSTETQIRVDIHSDSSGTTPKKIKPSKFDQETTGKIKDHKSNHIHDQVVRTGSMSSYRSTSPENIDTPSLQKRQTYQQNRSPSPYSFDSIPSSHADSPLPKKRFSSELYRQDSDADSRVSGVSGISGTAEHSGTESVVKDSGEEDYTVEELSNIRFRRVSRKNGKSQRSSEHSPIDDEEVHRRGSSGKGRVHVVDLPEAKGFVQISEISLFDIEKDVDNDSDAFLNLDFVPPPSSNSHGKGVNLSDKSAGSPITNEEAQKSSQKSVVDSKQNIPRNLKRQVVTSANCEISDKSVSKTEPKIDAKIVQNVHSLQSPRESQFTKKLKSNEKSEKSNIRTEKDSSEQIQREFGGKKIETKQSQLERKLISKTSKMQATSQESKKKVATSELDVSQKKNKDQKSKKSVEASKINKQMKTFEAESRDLSFEELVLEKDANSKRSVDSEFDEIFNIAMADLSVDESTTDMSDAGSFNRAKGKKIKKLMKKRKVEKKEKDLSIGIKMDKDPEDLKNKENIKSMKNIHEVKEDSKHRKEYSGDMKSEMNDKNKYGTIEKKSKEENKNEVTKQNIERPNEEKKFNDQNKSTDIQQSGCVEQSVEVTLSQSQNVEKTQLERGVTPELVTEEVINPVRIVREEASTLPIAKLEKIELSMTKNFDKNGKQQRSEHDQLDSKRETTDKKLGTNLSSGETIRESKDCAVGIPSMVPEEFEQMGEINFDDLTMEQIGELMRRKVIPMDEQILNLIEFSQNREKLSPALMATGSCDSDELSIIQEESEPSESDTSTEQNQVHLGNSEQEDSRVTKEIHTEDLKPNIGEINTTDVLEQVKSSEYELSIRNEKVSLPTQNVEVHGHDVISEKSSELENSVPIDSFSKQENFEKNISVGKDESQNARTSTEDLQKFYQEIKEQVALECYMETQKLKNSQTDSIHSITDENLPEDLNNSQTSTQTVIKELISKHSKDEQMGNRKTDSLKAEIFSEYYGKSDFSSMPIENLKNEGIEHLQMREKHDGIATDKDIQSDVSKLSEKDFTVDGHKSVDLEVNLLTSISDSSSKSVVQRPRASSVTLEVDESDDESSVVLVSNECRSPVKTVDEMKIEITSSPVEKMTFETDDIRQPSYMAESTPERKYNKPKDDTPHPEGYTPTKADLSADITITPAERSGDSENTFCDLLEDNTSDKEVKDITYQKLKESKKSDLVGQSLSREVLVKQWLTSKTESREDNSSPQSDSSELASDKVALQINPALKSETPACDLSSQQMTLPKLNMQEWKETGIREADSITKLSPRASSEGSASLEDSGHVSGASTQENTPEHRRTDSLQSQASMASSKLSTLTDKESEDDPDIDEIVRSHRSLQGSMGGSRGNLLSAMTESRESIVSFYSNAGDVDYGKIPITGDIQFGLDYNYRTGTLEIQMTQCKGLAPADTRRNRSDPYIKTYLLPDKTRSGKRKTKIKKHTLNPVFDEKLRYLISKSELENRTLWVTVWHNDRFGRNDFLGEVTINFDYYRFGDSAAKWYKLQERVPPHERQNIRFEQPTSLLTYKGDIILCLKYVPPEQVNRDSPSPSRKKARKPKLPGDKGQLHVLIKEARNLTAVRSNGYSDPFCKGQLQPDKEKQKTQVIKKECNPAWNCTMVFEDVTAENLREKSLELTIWDHDKLSSNDFLGGVRLNLGTGKSYGKIVDWMDARGEEISLWQAMVDRPNFWIDGALVLRSTMSKRK